MAAIRAKSLKLTAYLEELLDAMPFDSEGKPFSIISPRNAEARGAQLSLRLKPGLLEPVLAHLEEEGVVVDERKPDVIRVAPAALYNSFTDVWTFCNVFKTALEKAEQNKDEKPSSLLGRTDAVPEV